MAISYAISALPALTAYAGGDLLAIVDISDFTEAPTGTTKKITVASLFTNVAVTGTLSVAGAVTMSSSATVAGSLGVASDLNITNGAARSYTIRSNGAGELAFIDSTAVATRWKITATGVLSPEAPNASDLGTSSVRVATAYVTSLNASGVSTLGGLNAGNATFGTIAGTALSVTSAGASIAGGLTISSGGAGITGTATATAFSGPLTGNVTGVLTVATGTAVAGTVFKTAANGLVIQGAAGSSNDFVLTTSVNTLVANVPTGSNNIAFAGNITGGGTLAVVTSVQAPKYLGSGSTPGIAANAGAGTSPSLTIAGNDSFMAIQLTLGTSPSNLTAAYTVTFATAYSATPRIAIGFQSAGAATAVLYVTSKSTTGFTVAYANALGSGQQLFADFQVGL